VLVSMNHSISDAIANHLLFFILIQPLFIHYSYTYNLMWFLRKGQDFGTFLPLLPLPVCLHIVFFFRSNFSTFTSLFLPLSSPNFGRPSKQHLLSLRSFNVLFYYFNVKILYWPGEIYTYVFSPLFQRHLYPYIDTMCWHFKIKILWFFDLLLPFSLAWEEALRVH
jgi:hypothetical protein